MIGLMMAALALATPVDPGPLDGCPPPPGWEAIDKRQTRYIVFGEVHGTAEAPALVGDLACALSFRGERLLVALELGADDDAALQAAWALPDDRFAAALTHVGRPGRNDGVASRAVFALLRRLHRLREGGRPIDVLAFNGTRAQEAAFATLPGQGPHEAAQADDIRRADAGRHDRVLVLVGDLHARKAPVTNGGDTFEPMAIRLAPASAVTSLAMRSAGGTAWTCALRAGFAFQYGKPLPDGAIECAAHPASASATLAGGAVMGLGDAPGARPEPAYDGYFWLGPITASPPQSSPAAQ